MIYRLTVLAFAAALAFFAWAFYTNSQTNAYVTELKAPAITKEALDSAEQSAVRGILVTGVFEDLTVFATFGVWTLGVLSCGGVLIFLGVSSYSSIVRVKARRYARDEYGMLPLVTVNGQLTDPNKAVFAVLADNTPDTVSTQAALQLAISNNRTISTHNLPPKLSANAAKLIAGKYDPQLTEPKAIAVKPTPPAEPVLDPVVLISFQEAWNQARPHKWIMGQAPDGQLAILNLKTAVHVGVLGATGTGKTFGSTLLLAMYARAFKWPTVVLDGKGGADWDAFSALLEVWPMDYASIGEQISVIQRIHQTRKEILIQAGAPTLDALKPAPFPHMLVVLEEFGTVMDNLRSASRATAAQVEAMLGDLMRTCRMTGIHFAICDQLPKAWPPAVRANIKYWISYKLQGGLAAVAGMYATNKLLPVGEFMTSDTQAKIFNSWSVGDLVTPLLSRMPRVEERLLETPPPVQLPPPVAADHLLEVQDSVPSAPVKEDAAPSTRERVAAYLAEHPEATQADLRRDLSLSNGLAHRLFHELRA